MKDDPRSAVVSSLRHRVTASPARAACAALLAAALACAGCGQQPWVAEGNYFTYDHPFTEAAAESARQNALGRCRQRDEIAIQTSRSCSLTQCTTSYQCISADDARKIGEKK